MKVILQDFEPQARVATNAAAAMAPVRKPRLRLNPVMVENRLFHAL
ncbi:hypothetical protein [Polymorphobacter fuscus]|nr:hypothetical protein [Polymorphobacter fuscus]NJC07764.1 hypothetical protein [Polymorphobacter fuscus]